MCSVVKIINYDNVHCGLFLYSFMTLYVYIYIFCGCHDLENFFQFNFFYVVFICWFWLIFSCYCIGPFKINGVPLRRVNQSYVIGTSTKVDISGVNVDKFDDKYFAKEGEKKRKKGENEFFEAEKEVGFLTCIVCTTYWGFY